MLMSFDKNIILCTYIEKARYLFAVNLFFSNIFRSPEPQADGFVGVNTLFIIVQKLNLNP